MLKIRLMRIGGKQKPFYRVVAVDERQKRTGAYIELLGTYNPLTTPHDIKLKQDRIDHWIKQGAQMSDGFLRIIGKAPQRPPRKPKKDKGESGKGKAESNQQEDKTDELPEETKIETTEQVTSVTANISEESSTSSNNPSNDKIENATEPEAPRNVTKEIENERPT